MILVTGATGNFGRAVIDSLLQKGYPASGIAALARDARKAEALRAQGVRVRLGSYEEYETLVSAFRGVEKLLLVSGNDVLQRTRQQANVVRAAQAAGVHHLFYTSVERRNEAGTSPMAPVTTSHLATEEVIRASGLAYTFFRNNVYLDVLPRFFGSHVLKTGIFLPAGNGKSAFALRREMAEAAANVLVSPGHEGKSYAFSNSGNTSFAEMAQALTQLTNRPVGYTSPSVEEFSATLTRQGLPQPYILGVARFAVGVQQGEFEVTTRDLEQLLGRPPTTPREFLQQTYGPAQ